MRASFGRRERRPRRKQPPCRLDVAGRRGGVDVEAAQRRRLAQHVTSTLNAVGAVAAVHEARDAQEPVGRVGLRHLGFAGRRTRKLGDNPEVGAQLRPGGEAVTAGERQLGVGARELGRRASTSGRRAAAESGMEFRDQRERRRIAGARLPLQGFRLVLEVLEAGLFGERAGPFRGPVAACAAGVRIARRRANSRTVSAR